ncbi:hypothetical protein [Serratia sp. 2723]|uniref:hypothetical protein n=1 Tax=unclassified Serratia (in: enterobacteria) TaxID=2647522 RepID=UPI003D1C03C3
MGAFIRKSINDDKKLLLVLRMLLPAYDGDGLVVYRGENLDRYYQGAIGFCWTTKKEKAEQFARGLNLGLLGGVLMKAWAPRSSILAGVHPHSRHLGEHEITVNGSAVQNLQLLERFPPKN